MIFSYNNWLVLLSIGIALLASYTSLNLASRIIHTSGRASLYWFVGGSFSMGMGIWAMHFIGMLALHLPIDLAYDIPITLLSIVPAIAASAIALLTIRRGLQKNSLLLVSAIAMGVGISAMHYTGMAALKMQPPIEYTRLLVVLSVSIAMVASLAALKIILMLDSYHGVTSAILLKLGGATVMAGAIAGMHYTGMAAANFLPNSLCLANPHGLGGELMALIIGIGSFVLMLTTLLVSIFDTRLADQNLRTAEQFRVLNAELDSYFQAIGQHAIISVADNTGLIIKVNEKFCEISGYTQAELIGQNHRVLNSGKHSKEFFVQMWSTIAQGNTWRGEVCNRTKSGSLYWVDSAIVPLKDSQGKIIRYISVRIDTTKRKNAEDDLRIAAAVFETEDAVLITDANANIIRVNSGFSRITGYAAEEVLGKNPSIMSSGRQDRSFFTKMWQQLLDHGTWSGEIWDKRKNGKIYPKLMTITAVKNELQEITQFVAIFSDITARKQLENEIHNLAYYDVLTELPNRRLFLDRFNLALSFSARHDNYGAIMFIDMDNFKKLNDTLGHECGDLMLVEVGKRIKACVRETDTVARFGGDEFVVLLEGIGDEQSEALVQVPLLAEKIREKLAIPYKLNQHIHHSSPSIGVCLFHGKEDTVEILLEWADKAMYQAKSSGRNAVRFFNSVMRSS